MTAGIDIAELPEVLKTWRDFLECRLPVLPGFAEIGRIAELADSILTCGMKLKKQVPPSGVDLPPGCVAVVANISAGLFGGPLSQLLKCLAAVKVRGEFEKNGVSAVAVCYVSGDSPPGFSPWEICLVDRGSKLHCLKSSADGNEVERIFPDGDREALSALKEAFAPGLNVVASCARWFEYLLKDFGVIVVEDGAVAAGRDSGGSEPRCLRQGRELPVAAFVADSLEIGEYVKALPLYEREGIPRPLVWPCPDATISGARSMKTLKRYGLDFTRLFEGKERVMDYVRGTLKSDVPDGLRKLLDEARAVLDELETAAFAARAERSDRVHKARAARITYQLEKIQRHSRGALADKEKAAENRIRKACDFLAPLGRRQQDTLGAAQIPLSYGLAGLHALYERLDIATTNHQLMELI